MANCEEKEENGQKGNKVGVGEILHPSDPSSFRQLPRTSAGARDM